MGKLETGMTWARHGRSLLLGCLLMLGSAPYLEGHTGERVWDVSDVAVIDGDTLEIDGKPVSISGIDAPELGQLCRNRQKAYRCGLEAALNLRSLIAAHRSIVCNDLAEKPENQKSCMVGNRDLGDLMLRRGYAVVRPDAPAPYRSAEQEARNSSLGIWRGEFIPPDAWREGKRLPEIEGEPIQSCDIKGLINAEGRKIYVVPTDPNYDEIEIDSKRGERLFCSDDEAEFHGWRRSPRRR